MNHIDQHHAEVLLDEAKKQLGCQLLNKTSEVGNINAELLEMEYLTLFSPEKGSSKRRRNLRNVTIPSPEEVKEKKFVSPSFLYILTLIIQQNPFSFSCNVLQKPPELSESYYYILNNCVNDCQPR